MDEFASVLPIHGEVSRKATEGPVVIPYSRQRVMEVTDK